MACNLAAALAQKSNSCGLIDLHLRGGDLANLLNVVPRHSLGSLAGKAHRLDAAMFEQSLITHECGIHLLASPEPFSDYRQITIETTQRILQFARERFPFVVVDLEDIEHGEQIRTLAVCNRVIMPLRPDYVALSHGKRYLDYLSRAKVPREHVTIVVNRTGQPRELPADCIAEALGVSFAHGIPNDPAAVSTSYNLGIPLTVSAPSSPVSKSIRRLVDGLLGESHPQDDAVAGVSWREKTVGAWSRLQSWIASGFRFHENHPKRATT